LNIFQQEVNKIGTDNNIKNQDSENKESIIKAVHDVSLWQEKLIAAINSESIDDINKITSELPSVEIAEFLNTLENPERKILFFNIYNPLKQGEVLVESDENVQTIIFPDISNERLIAICKELENDDAAYLINNIKPEFQHEILEFLNPEKKQNIISILSYPQDSAGSIMQSVKISLRSNTTVQTVLRYIRDFGPIPNNINTLYVVDELNRLQGEVHINELIALKQDDQIKQCIKKDIVSINANTDQEDVGRLFSKYDLISAPVVNLNNKLIGRITVDDIIDVIREEADEDLLSLGGIKGAEDLFGSIFNMSIRRFTWIGVNLIMVFLASIVVSFFDATIEHIVALAILMPIVANMGGNLGSQTLTSVVRAMALDQIQDHNKKSLILKQIGIGIFSGIFWGLIVGSIVFLWFKDQQLSLVIASAMTINLTLATLFGAIIPITLDKYKIDPALAGGIVLTASTDIIGFLSFLGLATWFMM